MRLPVTPAPAGRDERVLPAGRPGVAARALVAAAVALAVTWAVAGPGSGPATREDGSGATVPVVRTPATGSDVGGDPTPQEPRPAPADLVPRAP